MTLLERHLVDAIELGLSAVGVAGVALGAVLVAFVVYVVGRLGRVAVVAFLGGVRNERARRNQPQPETRAGAPWPCGGATPAVAGRDAPRRLARVSDSPERPC